MDSHDLFKKLASGTRFNLNRFRKDAERFQLVKQKTSEDNVKSHVHIKEETKSSETNERTTIPAKRKYEEDTESKENQEAESLTLLKDIKIMADGKKKKRKKQKTLTEKQKLDLQEAEEINHLRKQFRISVSGRQVPNPIRTLEELSTVYSFPQQLMNNLKTCGYSVPTPIQMQALPAMLQSRQILASAPTGSGKTMAFLLPLLHHLRGPQGMGFRAMILCPTMELVKQIYRECLRLSEGCRFRINTIKKTSQALQKYGLNSSQKFDVLITTPKRLVSLLNQDPPAVSLSNVEWLIIDEADKLFEEGMGGFREQLEAIIKACTNPNLKRALFGATKTPVVAKWCRRNLKDLITIAVGHRNAASDLVEQELLYVGNERGKLIAFRNIIQQGISPPVLVFVQSKQRAQELFTELLYDGINVDVIHADRTQTQRDNVVKCFREGKIWVLICTELMGRGIDFKGVNLVVNYDFPPSAISYVHRIGRTGRAGHRGKAITFCTQQDMTHLRSIAAVMRDSGCEVPEYMLKLKKCSKRKKRELLHKAPRRERISTNPEYKPRFFKKRKDRETKSRKKNVSTDCDI